MPFYNLAHAKSIKNNIKISENIYTVEDPLTTFVFITAFIL